MAVVGEKSRQRVDFRVVASYVRGHHCYNEFLNSGSYLDDAASSRAIRRPARPIYIY
jgi:hypothetical protein